VRRRANFIAVLAIIAVNVICLELVARAATRSFFRARGLTYLREVPAPETLTRYLAERDPQLGWPSARRLKDPSFDALGARVNTHFPDVRTPPCVSVYGDSFTYSSEVDAVDAWPNQLSALLGCRVNNFGVGGYGTDQAFLRMRRNELDRPGLLVIAHASIDIIRNLIPFDALRGGDVLGFKPRFRLSVDGELRLEPLPSFATPSEWEAVYRNPAAHFPDVWLEPGTARGLPIAGPPYVLSMLRALRSWEMNTYFDPARVYYEELYEPDHPSGALPLTEAILQSFCAEAAARGSRCLVIVIPVARDVLARKHSGAWPYRTLLSKLAGRGLPVLDLGDAVLQASEGIGGDHCVFYRRTWYAKGGCTGHFNAEGYRILAETVAAFIKERDL
jgi:hypothetical protein